MLTQNLASRALFVFFASLPPAFAAEIFVSPGGQGDGSLQSPLGLIQDALDLAGPGDVITLQAGVFEESIQTVRDGSPDAPITLRAEPGALVEITFFGRVLEVIHAHFVVEGIIFDGQFGQEDAIKVRDGASFWVLRDSEVRRSTLDCIDMGAPANVLIEGSLIHHCLNAADGRTDAHGITGGAVRDLTIRDTEIHTFSGDAVQFDPGRSLPGWDNILIDGCLFRLEPLPAPENGFAAGVVPGENAIDTKTNPDAPRARLFVRNTTAIGFRGGLIGNMAAFNIKERVDASFDRVTVSGSEIAFRLRGPDATGARVTLQNALIFDVDTAFRYEDDIEVLTILQSTLGRDVLRVFQDASSPATVPGVQNLLLLGDALPPEAEDPSNLAVSPKAFVSLATDDYRLVEGAPAVDTGVSLDGVLTDRDGIERPQGAAFDIGAFELCQTAGGCEPIDDPIDPGEPPLPGAAGCGCRVAGAPGLPVEGVLLLLGILLLRRRRGPAALRN